MKKRILIFSLVYYPRFVGGAEVAIKEITDRLGDDFEFDMVTLRKHALPFEKVGNVNVYRVGFPWYGKNTQSLKIFPLSKYAFPFFAFFKAHSLHKKYTYDATWSMMANYAGFGALFFKMTHPKVPFVLTLQEGDPLSHIRKRVGMFYPLFKKIFLRADRIQTISWYLADFAKSMGYTGKVEVIPNGVDTKHFGKIYSQEEIDSLKKKLHKKENDIFLVTTSRLAVKNAVDDLIKSLQFLPENVKCLVIGTGSEEDNLKKLARDLSLDDRVKFIGFVDHDMLPLYLRVSDVFIRPSLSEGFGNSFVEAMAAEIPVLATPVGGIVDFLFDPDMNKDREPTGLFVRVKDPRDIAKKVTRILNNPALREQIILSAKKMVLNSYDWNTVAKDMKDKVFSLATKNV